MREVISRHDALLLGLSRYYTGHPCKRGHLDERTASGRVCVSCFTTWRRAQRKQSDAASYARHRIVRLAAQALWRKANKARRAAYNAQWRTANPALAKARGAARRIARLHACPAWVDRDAIARIYSNCPDGHHVDHIIPLQGEVVCGLHVPWNLQYLPAAENIAKGNRLPGA